MRYLVTGGAGFIGSNTVDELVQRGHGVVVLDDLSGGKEDNLAEVRNKITLIKGSITDLEVVRKAMHEAEFVLHLGARTSVPRSVKDPLETNRINVEGTLNVLVAAKEMKVKRVVFAASSSIRSSPLCAKSAGSRSKPTTKRPAKAISATPRRTFRWHADSSATSPRSALNKACASPSTGTATRKSKPPPKNPPRKTRSK